MTRKASVVTAVDRSLDIMEYVGETSGSVSVQDMCDKLGIPPSSCFRIVSNLVARDYLAESFRGPGRYVLGHKVLHLAACATEDLDVRSIALPYMLQIARAHQYTVNIGAFQGDLIYLLEQVPRNSVLDTAYIHAPLPVNIGATSKILCAYLPPMQRNMYVRQSPFEVRTSNSIAEKDAYLLHLDQVAEQGYALDREEYDYGMACIATPIFDFRGCCIAAMSITDVKAAEFTDEAIEKMKRVLDEACGEISHWLGYRASTRKG